MYNQCIIACNFDVFLLGYFLVKIFNNANVCLQTRKDSLNTNGSFTLNFNETSKNLKIFDVNFRTFLVLIRILSVYLALDVIPLRYRRCYVIEDSTLCTHEYMRSSAHIPISDLTPDMVARLC